MAKTKTQSGLSESKSEEQRRVRNPMWGALGVLCLIILVITLLFLLLFSMRKAFFSSNSHFKLKKLEIVGGSYWQGKEKHLCQRTGIKLEDNLFALDYRKLRKQIESISGIEKAEVVRILPDKLRIRVSERLPRAALFNPAGRYVVDEKGVVILRSESAAHGSLPVITAVPGYSRFQQGETLETLLPSLDLIMMTLRNFPDIDIECVQPIDQEKLTFFMRYRGGKRYKVTIPLNNRGLPYLLSALQTAIINAHWKKLNVTSINLLFDGRVVLK